MDWNRAAAVITLPMSCWIGLGWADTPAFDRTGIAFSTDTLPARNVAWEHGMPDFAHTSDKGVSSTLYTFDTTLRVNAERADGSNGFDVSPNLNFAVSRSVAAFIEAGAAYSGHGLDQALAGGGFTMMVAPVVQLDVSADFGLTSRSRDVLAGFGISVFFQ